MGESKFLEIGKDGDLMPEDQVLLFVAKREHGENQLGSCVTSIRELCLELGLSPSAVRDALGSLVRAQCVRTITRVPSDECGLFALRLTLGGSEVVREWHVETGRRLVSDAWYDRARHLRRNAEVRS